MKTLKKTMRNTSRTVVGLKRTMLARFGEAYRLHAKSMPIFFPPWRQWRAFLRARPMQPIAVIRSPHGTTAEGAR